LPRRLRELHHLHLVVLPEEHDAAALRHPGGAAPPAGCLFLDSTPDVLGWIARLPLLATPSVDSDGRFARREPLFETVYSTARP
jgi:hypothetical protein